MSSAAAWDDGHWPGLATLDQDIRCDLCVVGLGGSGLTAVQEAQQIGMQAVGIDAGEVAVGATGRNGGFLLAGLARFHHQVIATIGRELAVALYRETLVELATLRAQASAHVRITGSLRIADSEEERRDCEAQQRALRADGFEVEPYDGPEGHGLLIPSDGVFNPLARARSLASEVVAAGARLFERTRAIEFKPGQVITPRAVIHCDAVLVAVDGRLDLLFPELPGNVRTARLQMLATEPTTEIALTRPVYARWGYDYWQQLPDGRVVLGGARDMAEQEEWTASTETSSRIQRVLEVSLRERLRVHARITHRWAASVGYTPHGIPLVTELRPKLWVIGGYNGTGNIVGALCARAVIEQLKRGHSPRLELLQQAARRIGINDGNQ
ncbi:MAG: FAD-dependent oxidoreductase [Steroidobacteraceae bacterium]